MHSRTVNILEHTSHVFVHPPPPLARTYSAQYTCVYWAIPLFNHTPLRMTIIANITPPEQYITPPLDKLLLYLQAFFNSPWTSFCFNLVVSPLDKLMLYLLTLPRQVFILPPPPPPPTPGQPYVTPANPPPPPPHPRHISKKKKSLENVTFPTPPPPPPPFIVICWGVRLSNGIAHCDARMCTSTRACINVTCFTVTLQNSISFWKQLPSLVSPFFWLHRKSCAGSWVGCVVMVWL